MATASACISMTSATRANSSGITLAPSAPYPNGAFQQALHRSLRQGHANQFLVGAGVDTAVGAGGVTPDHVPAGRRAGPLEHLPAAHFFVALRRQLGDDQLPQVVEQEEAVAVLHHERR